jgi:hypothetical protein
MEDKPTTFPTWGYKDDGSAQIFDLKEGEELPEGWDAECKPWNHPNSRHLHSRPSEPQEPHEHEEPKRRGPGRPRSTGQAPGASAIELRDE